MNKLFLFLIILLLSSSLVSAYYIDVENKGIDKHRYEKILDSINQSLLDDINIIYLGGDDQQDIAYAWYDYNYNYKKKTGKIIKTYNSRITLNYVLDGYNDNFIKCVVLHELGHHNEVLNDIEYKDTKLSEDYANVYSWNNGCTDLWYYQIYVQDLSNLTK